MHSAEFSLETLEHIWNNYHVLGQYSDIDRMSSDRMDILAKGKARLRPLMISAWLATQGFFMSAWSIWEYHSGNLCKGLPNKVSRGKPHVQWVASTFAANGKTFAELAWFTGGNALRNLITHHAARAIGVRAEGLLEQARSVFSDLQIDSDGYVLINHNHASALKWKVGEFMLDPAAVS